ncbi:MAG: LysM peptidoglycan-binding domain-containing protein, partial [Actinobacteria bacterium]
LTHRARRGSRPTGLSALERAAVAAVVAGLAVAVWIAAAPTGATPDATSTVRVDSGDTLWMIAESHPAPGLTTAENVELIISLNGLRGSALAAGAHLKVAADAPKRALAMR